MDIRQLQIIIPHTAPVMPVVNLFQHGNAPEPQTKATKDRAEKIYLLNNSIFLKAEFAKQSYRIIVECYEKYGELLEDGNYLVRPIEILPAWREVDNLLFELGSILDFFSREVNLAFSLGIKRDKVGFGRVVRECKKQIPDEKITQSLVSFSDSGLYKYFRGMRNRITHRLPFVIRGMNDQIFFPDEPNDDDVVPKTTKYIDVCVTIEKWINEILGFVDRASILVFTKIAKLEAYNKITGEELTIEQLIETTRQELEARLETE